MAREPRPALSHAPRQGDQPDGIGGLQALRQSPRGRLVHRLSRRTVHEYGTRLPFSYQRRRRGGTGGFGLHSGPGVLGGDHAYVCRALALCPA